MIDTQFYSALHEPYGSFITYVAEPIAKSITSKGNYWDGQFRLANGGYVSRLSFEVA